MINRVNVLPSTIPFATHSIEAIEFQQDLFNKVEERHGAGIRRALTFALDFIKHLRGSEIDKAKFLRHDFWSGKPYKPNPERISLLVMQFIYGVAKSGGAKYERARKHSRIVEWYLDQNYTADEMRFDLQEKTLDDVEDRLEAEPSGGGILDLVDDNRQIDPIKDRNKANRGLLDTDRECNGAISSAPAVQAQVEKRQTITSYPFDDLREVAIEADLPKIDYLRQLPVGATTLVRIKRKLNGDDWAKFEAIAIVGCRGR